ncbi:hypothetical protein L6452_05935 [Arctium lappa]|uniref:Uncharacterized protein n=1 Tax=Arctium lappa TaxID=4217 RepID=A0ACB9EI85_ARCLA|nr:hypothetical protein L6452_05935 [Arctium lappa]
MLMLPCASPASSSYGEHSDEKDSSFVGIDELQQEHFLEVKVDFQETFLGNTSPISCCRFSTSGEKIASASVDGKVRIWTYDSTTSVSRNATINYGADNMSLKWNCKSDRLALLMEPCGTNICVYSSISRAWHRRNMRTWKAMTILPIGKDPLAITSLCFNHNVKILATAVTDIDQKGRGYLCRASVVTPRISFCLLPSEKSARVVRKVGPDSGISHGSCAVPSL